MVTSDTPTKAIVWYVLYAFDVYAFCKRYLNFQQILYLSAVEDMIMHLFIKRYMTIYLISPTDDSLHVNS